MSCWPGKRSPFSESHPDSATPSVKLFCLFALRSFHLAYCSFVRRISAEFLRFHKRWTVVTLSASATLRKRLRQFLGFSGAKPVSGIGIRNAKRARIMRVLFAKNQSAFEPNENAGC